MAAAARVGDATSHGTNLSPGTGSLNVKIGNQPAWRATVDTHLCPLTTGTVPHVEGRVTRGSSKVLINKFSAARQGDQLQEKGPPNSITGGYMKVQIGG